MKVGWDLSKRCSRCLLSEGSELPDGCLGYLHGLLGKCVGMQKLMCPSGKTAMYKGRLYQTDYASVDPQQRRTDEKDKGAPRSLRFARSALRPIFWKLDKNEAWDILIFRAAAMM